MKKINYKKISFKVNVNCFIYFFILTMLIFLLGYFVAGLLFDEIWIYGFSYNIASGLIPYNDFNMIILPFYSLLIGGIFKIVGANLIMFHFVNAIIISLILIFVHKKNPFNSLIMACFLTLYLVYGYNLFASMILILILYLENNNYKYKNEVIGLLIGSILMTKINLGIFMFIPYFIYSRKKIKSLIWTSIIPLIILIYLIINNNLFNCIDYCFLGLKNFSDNLLIDIPILVVDIIIIVILLYKYIKTKDKNLLYLILYQGINYPLCDSFHFSNSLFPIIYYYLNYGAKENIKNIIKIFGVIIAFMTIIFNVNTNYTFNRQVPFTFLHSIENYIINHKDKKIYIFSSYAYPIKLDLNMRINKYDLINKGNMGRDEYSYIRELNKECRDSDKCLFILVPEEFDAGQTNNIMRDYVIENYKLIDKVSRFEIYGKEELKTLK